MLFADDIVICEKTREEVEQRESWRYALERRGMKVSRSKTEYLCINGENDNETVKMEDTKMPRVKEFKYLGSTVQESGNCEREVKKRVQGRWNRWRKVLGVICDRRSSSFEGYPLQARHKQNWGRGFILLLPQTAALPESDAGSDVIKPASSFVIQNCQTSCSMWCPMYRARC